jgi:hypothetical protein
MSEVPLYYETRPSAAESQPPIASTVAMSETAAVPHLYRKHAESQPLCINNTQEVDRLVSETRRKTTARRRSNVAMSQSAARPFQHLWSPDRAARSHPRLSSGVRCNAGLYWRSPVTRYTGPGVTGPVVRF